ncbi:hypothetical protein Pmani_025863 [Petrolisthes manimaculis]|uniref:Uncharacterized protein n=1 Tax=Petrolisthes manimaculis TaxID=1843537 RepID=A0AAE1TXZ6_9EUCA|nr:hypothetical protein Pmani_025863 [Petrolisthes manimaculis]
MDERCGVVQVSSAPPRPASQAAATKAPPPHHRGLATLGPQVVLTGTSTSKPLPSWYKNSYASLLHLS